MLIELFDGIIDIQNIAYSILMHVINISRNTLSNNTNCSPTHIKFNVGIREANHLANRRQTINLPQICILRNYRHILHMG